MSWLRDDSEVFNNEFDLTERSLDEIEVKETRERDNCFVWDKVKSETAYNCFILDKNSQSKIICEISFHKSSDTGKYLPRPIFKRLSLDGDIRKTKSEDKVIINLSTSEKAKQYWKLIGFLFKYKDLVDLDEFERSYEVFSLDKYMVQFKNKSEQDQVEELKELVRVGDITSSGIKSLTFENRKKNLRAFFILLRNDKIDGKEAQEYYREKYDVSQGKESIWHHFLKMNDWILGLNADIRFMKEFLDEQKVGSEDSKGKGSPKTDLLGVSDFTTLIELKHPDTKIFKKIKSKGRANTWDFTSDFFEGVSQCLGQKFELEKAYESKKFVDENGKRLDKSVVQTIDPKGAFIVGNKKEEFPTKDRNDDNLRKNETLQRIRRNNRNIDIITYDELFERAYHIVYSRKLEGNWYWKEEKDLFD